MVHKILSEKEIIVLNYLADKEETISNINSEFPFHQAAHFLQKSPALALIDCICRITFNKCDKPRKVCLVLGDQAEFFIDRGIGEKIDTG